MSKSVGAHHGPAGPPAPFGTPGAGQGAWGKKSQLNRTCNGRVNVSNDSAIT